MATPTAGVLNEVLNTFRTQIDSGFGTLIGPVQGTLGILIVISVATMAIMWAVDETHHIWGHLIRKILLVGFWAFLITNWHPFSIALISGFGKLGIGAGGGAGGISDFLNNPSQVFKLGLDNAKALLEYANYLMGNSTKWGKLVAPVDPISWIGFELSQIVDVLEVLLATLIMIVAYGWLALEIVVTVIEFHIVTLVAFCVLPFGVFSRTSTLAEGAVGYVFRAGFKAMVLGIIIALGSKVLNKYTIVAHPGPLPTLDSMAGLALGVLVVLMLAIHAPRYASAVISGAPSNSAGSLVGAAGGVAAATGLATRMAAGGVRGGYSAAASVAKTLNNDFGGGSASAARAASSVGGSGGGGSAPSPGAPRAPSPAPGGGGSPQSPSSGGSASSSPSGLGGLAAGAAEDAADVVAAEGISEAGSSQPSSPASGRGSPAWYATPGGVSSLTSPQLAAARRSYDLWTSANPSTGNTFNFNRYVEYAQQRHAESADASEEQDEE